MKNKKDNCFDCVPNGFDWEITEKGIQITTETGLATVEKRTARGCKTFYFVRCFNKKLKLFKWGKDFDFGEAVKIATEMLKELQETEVA